MTDEIYGFEFPKQYCGRCGEELVDWLVGCYPQPVGLVCGDCDRHIRMLQWLWIGR